MQQKYVWDIAVQEKYTEKKRKIANEVSRMVSFGGNVKDMRLKLRQLNIL
jgi:hypothetical protein